MSRAPGARSPSYEYIFVVIIGVCLKLSQHTEVIEKILHEIPTDDLTFIKQRLDSIVDMSVKSATPPHSIARGLREDYIINVPYPDDATIIENDPLTHRSIELSNGNILRIRN